MRVRRGTIDFDRMDAGYFAEDAVGAVTAEGFDPHIAVGRQKHHPALPEPGDGAPPDGSTVKEQMAHKLRTPAQCHLL